MALAQRQQRLCLSQLLHQGNVRRSFADTKRVEVAACPADSVRDAGYVQSSGYEQASADQVASFCKDVLYTDAGEFK